MHILSGFPSARLNAVKIRMIYTRINTDNESKYPCWSVPIRGSLFNFLLKLTASGHSSVQVDVSVCRTDECGSGEVPVRVCFVFCCVKKNVSGGEKSKKEG